jgi:hypothetical protein
MCRHLREHFKFLCSLRIFKVSCFSFIRFLTTRSILIFCLFLFNANHFTPNEDLQLSPLVEQPDK